MSTILKKVQKALEAQDGSPYFCGALASWGGYGYFPCKWVFDENGELVGSDKNLTPEEVEAYNAGYEDNNAAQNWFSRD